MEKQLREMAEEKARRGRDKRPPGSFIPGLGGPFYVPNSHPDAPPGGSQWRPRERAPYHPGEKRPPARRTRPTPGSVQGRRSPTRD